MAPSHAPKLSSRNAALVAAVLPFTDKVMMAKAKEKHNTRNKSRLLLFFRRSPCTARRNNSPFMVFPPFSQSFPVPV